MNPQTYAAEHAPIDLRPGGVIHASYATGTVRLMDDPIVRIEEIRAKMRYFGFAPSFPEPEPPPSNPYLDRLAKERDDRLRAILPDDLYRELCD